MKNTELMIGDWVILFDKYPAKVEAICDVEVYLLDEVDLHWHVDYAFIKPIPLTAEILEKNGFVYNDLPFVQAWEQFGLALYSSGNGYRIGCGNNVALIIDSVHELQHALRLCGIEKEIEL